MAKKSETVPGCVGAAVAAGQVGDEALFGRVAAILEQARANVVRAVNHNMVVAYWLIGREIVMELQRGQERAGYGEDLVADLSQRLTRAYGAGWSRTNLWSFRLFFSMYQDRGPTIPHTLCVESGQRSEMIGQCSIGGAFCETGTLPLSWSHYRALIRVRGVDARDYYEQESIAANWTVRELERQIHTQYYERLVATQARRGRMARQDAQSCPDASALTLDPVQAPTQDPTPVTFPAPPASPPPVQNPLDALKDPYVLEFLDIPDPAALHESGLESAIIGHLRDFLLELGRGFAFVARQKRLSFDGDDLYVDLVFYNCILKCYLLIDLKMGRLTAGDVGQMDSYVRMFDDRCAARDDNPTIGLILCTDRNNAVARYSVLNDRRQIFASRYVTCLPTEAEFVAELARERRLIEARATGEGLEKKS